MVRELRHDMKARRVRLALVATMLLVGGGVAWAMYIVHRLAHHGEGPRHAYALAGNATLTDEQAVSLAKQTLQLDNRFSEELELEIVTNESPVNRGDDKGFVSVSWHYPGTNRRWYVQLHRAPDRVEAVSYPGK